MSPVKTEKEDRAAVKKKILLTLPAAVLITGSFLFLPAGTLDYWEAWLFLGVLFIPFFLVVSYLMKRDPDLLARRMRFREKEASEQGIIKAMQLLFLVAFIIPGLDHRFGWSEVPVSVVILADIMIFLGYMLVFAVFRENSYTSRIVEVEKDQKVVTTGPYAVIRHPMYAGIIPMYLFIPLALGSYYALLPILPSIVFLIFRIHDEEKLLSKELKGYKAYCRKVRYRLIPGVW